MFLKHLVIRKYDIRGSSLFTFTRLIFYKCEKENKVTCLFLKKRTDSDTYSCKHLAYVSSSDNNLLITANLYMGIKTKRHSMRQYS